MLVPSKYQTDICDFARSGGGHGVVQAVAGSGKTTLLSMVGRAVQPKYGEVLCYNVSAKETLQAKMPPNIRPSTVSSVGHRAHCSAMPGKVELAGGQDGKPPKTARIITMLKNENKIARWFPDGLLIKVVGLAKNEGLVPEGARSMVGLVPDTLEQWTTMLDHYGIDTDERIPVEMLINHARQILQISIQYAHKIIDFDDQVYMSALVSARTFSHSEWLMVDELQDISPLQRTLLMRLIGVGGRFLGVGDRAQAIYGWRGASIDSMDQIIKATKAIELPLHVCYRCPTSVLDLAREIVPYIEAAPGAETGLVEYVDSYEPGHFKAGDLVVCRNRAPRTALAYKLLGARVPVRIIGGKGDSSLISFIESFGKRYAADLISAICDWCNRKIAQSSDKDADGDNAAVDAAVEMRDTILAIAEGSRANTVEDLKIAIRQVFSGPVEGKVLFGTIHSVKGMEADRVWFLDENLIPSPGAKRDWQRVQEKNLRYVALTRARRELRFINSGDLL